jgi:hypothetical protein
MSDELDKEFNQENSLDAEFNQEDSLDAEFAAEPGLMDDIKQVGKAVLSGGTIYGLQKVAERKGIPQRITKGTSSAAKKLLEVSGHLSEEQLNFIRDNYPEYKKAQSIKDTAQEYADLASQIKEKGYTDPKQARDLIKSRNISIPKETLEKQYAETLAEKTGSIPKKEDIKRYEKAKIKAQNEAKNKLKAKVNRLKQTIDPKRAREFEAEEATRKLVDKLKNRANKAQILGERVNYTDIIRQRDELVTVDTVKGEVISQKIKPVDPQKIARKFTDIKIDDYEKTAFVEDKKTGEKISQPIAETSVRKSKAPEVFEKYLKDSPVITDKKLQSQTKEIAEIMGDLSVDNRISGKNLEQLLDEYSSRTDYGGRPDASSKVFNEARARLRAEIGLKDAEIDKLFKEASRAIDDSKEMKSLMSLRDEIIESGGHLKPTSATIGKIEKIFGPKTERYAKERQTLEEILKKYQKADLITKGEASAVKEFVKNKTQLSTSGAMTAFATEKIKQGLGLSILYKSTIGTKVQEILAMALASAPGQLLKKGAAGVGKTAYKSLPFIGGAMAYSDARAAGYDPEVAMGIAMGEEITDFVPPVMAVKEAVRAEGLAPQAGTPQAKLEAGTSDFEAQKMLPRVDLKEESEKGLREDRQKEFAKKLEQGTITAKERRQLAEDTFKEATDNTKKYQELIQKLEGGTSGEQGYAEQMRRLQEAENDEERNAIKFQLEQQPAFRKLLEQYESTKKNTLKPNKKKAKKDDNLY